MILYYKMKEKIRLKMNAFFPRMMTKYYYKKILGRKLNLKKPQSFNEKISWLKFYHVPNNELAVICTDKYRVRNYVKSKGFGNYLNELLYVWDDVSDIEWNNLPESFAIKCNHGAGMNIICRNKSELNITDAKLKLKKWMKMDYGKMFTQPHYSKIDKKIICESYIENKEDVEALPADYKIHCFHGEPKLIAYYEGRENDVTGTLYDMDWNLLDISTNPGRVVPRPSNLEQILNIAKGLSEDFVYVRVDLYVQPDKIFFGELTFTPANGMSPTMTEEGDYLMGEWLDLEKISTIQDYN